MGMHGGRCVVQSAAERHEFPCTVVDVFRSLLSAPYPPFLSPKDILNGKFQIRGSEIINKKHYSGELGELQERCL